MKDSLDTPKKINPREVLNILESNGPLSRVLKGFESRPEQLKMTAKIVEAYNQNQIALIEAGTGTGKSLSYLIPALIWASSYQERTLISTNTITLQEQLLNKDIPLLIKALNLHLKVVLVKGMNNYICLRKIEDAQSELTFFPSEESDEIEKIIAWSSSTKEGSRAELPFIPSSGAWDKLGAESDACPHNNCAYYQQCFFFKARRQANDAQILIVNHHLLFADLQQRAASNNYNSSALLPEYQRIILDEAHHIEDIATEFFASRASRLELLRILGKLSSEKHNKGLGKLSILKEKLQNSFNKSPPSDTTSIFSSLSIDLPALKRKLLDHTHEAFEAFSSAGMQLLQATDLETEPDEFKSRLRPIHQSHPVWKNHAVNAAKILIGTIYSYAQELKSIESRLKLIVNERLQEQTKSIRFDIQALALRLEGLADLINEFISPLIDSNKVRWIEAQKAKLQTNIYLVDAHLDISKKLIENFFSKFNTIVLCSATLTSNKSFAFIRQRLGLHPESLPNKQITETIYESPFNYKQQALLVIPTDIPHPSHPDFIRAATDKIWEAIQASKGNTFILFTSYSMLQTCYDLLIERLQKNRYPTLKQGDDRRNALLEKFKNTDYSVLFGTDSFWEGVDVVGEALRCVVIVKLPFRVPSDPIIQARTEALIAKGKNPFLDYSIPHAIVKFKQGFGRLIRNKRDRGCVVCLDNRLAFKKYGHLFLSSLPPCQKQFVEGDQMLKEMQEFYRKTYPLLKACF